MRLFWGCYRNVALLMGAVLLAGCASTSQVALDQQQAQTSGGLLPAPAPLAEDAVVAVSPELSPDAVDATPARLVQAARYGQASVVNYLLEAGVSVDARNAYGDTPLIAAAGNGHSALVDMLLKRGADISSANKLGISPLMSAAARGDYQLVHTLVTEGAEVDAKNTQGETAIFLAVQYGHHSAVRVLLNAAAKLNIKNTVHAKESNSGFTPLMYAATHGLTRDPVDWPAMVTLLLNGGADPNITNTHAESALVFAQHQKDDAIVSILLQAGAKDTQAYAGLNVDDVLVKSARLGNRYMAEQALDGGADVNYVNDSGVTPLLAAAYEGHLAVVKMLVKKAAEIDFVTLGLRQFAMSKSHAPLNIRDLMAAASRGDTALIAAGRRGHTAVVEYLLKNGAQIDLPNRHGEVVVFVAAANGDSKLLRLLLDNGADANATEFDNRSNQLSLAKSTMGRDSVLMRAVQRGHLGIAKMLVEAGSDVNYRGFMGKTALYNAVENGRLNVVQYLISQKANVNTASFAGITPLMEAAKTGSLRLTEVLIDADANVNAIERPELGFTNQGDGSAGMTALMLASRGGHREVVKALLAAHAQVTVRNANGKLAIDEARDSGYEGIARLLSGDPGGAVSLFKYQDSKP